MADEQEPIPFRQKNREACDALIRQVQEIKAPIDKVRTKIAEKMSKADADYRKKKDPLKKQAKELRPTLAALDELMASIGAIKRIRSQSTAEAAFADVQKQVEELANGDV